MLVNNNVGIKTEQFFYKLRIYFQCVSEFPLATNAQALPNFSNNNSDFYLYNLVKLYTALRFQKGFCLRSNTPLMLQTCLLVSATHEAESMRDLLIKRNLI